MGIELTEHRLSLTKLADSLRNGAHSVFSASGSPMWMGCPGSLIPNLLMPDSGSQDAAYGTVGHAIGETWLQTGVKPRHLLNTDEWIVEKGVVFHVVIDDEMMDYVEQYVDWCNALPGQHFVETRVDYSRFTPLSHQGGTCDHAAVMPGVLIITDLKMGKGVRVYAERNTQLMLYALGFFLEWDEFFDFQVITVRVCQPRLEVFESWDLTRAELLAFAEEVKACSHAAWTLDAPRRASPKACQWCKVSPTCVAYVALQAQLTANVFSDLTLSVDHDLAADVKDKIASGELFGDDDVMSLSTEDMVKLLPYASFVTKWWASLKAELSRRIASGATGTGLKLVESNRTKRRFRNEGEAIAYLLENGVSRSDAVTEVVCSPSAAEKLLRSATGNTLANVKASISDFTWKPRGKPTLVPLSDKRQALENFSDFTFDPLDTNPETDDSED